MNEARRRGADTVMGAAYPSINSYRYHRVHFDLTVVLCFSGGRECGEGDSDGGGR